MNAEKITKFCLFIFNKFHYEIIITVDLCHLNWKSWIDLNDSEYENFKRLLYFTNYMVDEKVFFENMNPTCDPNKYYLAKMDDGTLVCKPGRPQFGEYSFIVTQGNLNEKLLNSSKSHYYEVISEENFEHFFNTDMDNCVY